MLTALIALAAATSPVTIIEDTRHACGVSRIDDAKRDRARSQVRALVKKYRAEGREVRVVKADGLLTISTPDQIRVSVPRC